MRETYPGAPDSEAQAFQEGRDASAAGAAISDNPYETTDAGRARAWTRGYLTQELETRACQISTTDPRG